MKSLNNEDLNCQTLDNLSKALYILTVAKLILFFSPLTAFLRLVV